MLRDTKSKGACLLACGVERISWLLTLECPSGILLLNVYLSLVYDGQVVLLNEQDDGTCQLGVELLVLRTAVEVIVELVFGEDRLDGLVALKDGCEPTRKALLATSSR